MKANRKRLMGAAALALTGALLLKAPPQPALMAIGDFLVIRDVLAPGEVIHVISGPDHRADYGIRLYQEGYGSRIFFTGGWCPVIQGNHAERGLARAASQGVPQQAIIADGGPRCTAPMRKRCAWRSSSPRVLRPYGR